MKKESYINYIVYTLSTYNKVNKRAILNIYKEEGLAKKKDKQATLFDSEYVDIDYNNLDNTLANCVSQKEKAIELYEKYQFTRSYRYSVLFKCNNFEKILIDIDKIPEYKFDPNDIRLFDEFKTPKRLETGENIILLFDRKFEAIHPQTSDELLLHYPVLVVFHKNNKIIEFRFDTIKRLFVEGERNQSIYSEIVDQLLTYLEQEYEIKFEAIDLSLMKNIADDETIEDIKLISQYMNMKNGSKAELNVGDNEEYVLPIIGELKNIMNDLKEELDKNVKIKDALEQFIYEKEETTDYPWIEILFLNKERIKTRNNHVKFVFNYMNKKYTLITYYYNDTLIGMERMNDVTNFIGENIKK